MIDRATLRGAFYLSWFMFLLILMEVLGRIARVWKPRSVT